MFQVRFHGRGGQGAVTAAELLSVAAFLEGKHAQAFPSFGPERSGAPVVAFCRIDDRPIRLREPVVEADAVVVQDATLLHSVDVFQGLGPHGFVLLNSSKSLDGLGLPDLVSRLDPSHARAVDASAVAQRCLGRPLANAALLGGLAALTRAVGLDAVVEAIATRFHGSGRAANEAAARAVYDLLAGAGPC
ncbi:MAG TPA: 2-oxoacid:acceptor oxidoreductase family protein [Polyangiaceae bacterium]|jgi:pyruvate ferredoxin oxidoreductase gamma subunit